MQALIFDPFSGAAGDMIVASLLDMGADPIKVRDSMESVADVSVSMERVLKRGISAMDVKVKVLEERTRNYHELLDEIRSASFPLPVERDAMAVFSILAEAESKIHHQSLDGLHFHEVGQSDALADVVGACTAIHELGPEHIYCTPITVGSGYVRSAHGVLPVPAPATLEILRSGRMLFKGGGFSGELLTPTGAAILSHFSTPVDSFPDSRPILIGYGAGDADTQHPNVLRAVLAEADPGLIQDHIEVLETNVDDVTGEVLGNLIEELLEMGAKDVTITPATMKKGRSGHIIHVIAKSMDTARLARKMIVETGSLGVRVIPTRHRLIAARSMECVSIEVAGQEYSIPVKVARDTAGVLLNMSAEYEDCRKVARISGVPLKDVMRRAEEVAWVLFG